MNGIDVSAADGAIDWAGAYAEGVEFALIRASAGMAADSRFAENIQAAYDAGIEIGVYHDLHAADSVSARAEAAVLLAQISPVRDKICLWAICRVEEVSCAPFAEEFLYGVAAGGFSPMLAADASVLPHIGGRYPLWLLFWGIPEARAMAYAPKIWQYGAGRTASMPRVHMNRGYFRDR